MLNSNYVLAGGSIVTPHRVVKDGALHIEEGVIKTIEDDNPLNLGGDAERIDCKGKIVMPGFVDVHTHGGMGDDFRDDSPDAVSNLSSYYFSHGVTSVLATLPPLPYELLIPAVKRIVRYCKAHPSSSNIIGIHLEGPYINELFAGGNRREYIEKADYDHWREIFNAGEGYIRLMTVAPELTGMDRIIKDAVKEGVVIALGHSSADSRIAASATELGASQVTHLFNGMRALHHREPSLLSESLVSDKLDAQIIADGVHVHPEIIGLTVKVKTPEHVCMITDSMRAAGLVDGDYDSAGHKVKVVNGISRLPNGTLAGSTLTFEKGLRLLAGLPGVDMPSVSRMTSLTAARSLGIDKKTGSIDPGKTADLVILDENFEVLMTIKDGGIKFMRESRI